jgi:hypothetical protein
MYSLITTSRANGPQARSQPAPLGNRRSPQRTVHAKPSPISTRHLFQLSGATGLIASPAPLPPCRFSSSLTNRPALPTRHPPSPGIPNDPSPIFGHSTPPLRHPSTANIRTTHSRPSSISIDRRPHSIKKISQRLSVSASKKSSPSHPNPSVPNDPNPILEQSTLRLSVSASNKSSPSTAFTKILLKCTKKATPSCCQPRWITVRGAHVDL